MRTVFFLAVLAPLLLAGTAVGQQNPLTSLLDSPVKSDREIYQAGEQIVCSLPLPGTAAMFGADTVDGSAANKTFITDELFAPFRVWEGDGACQLVQTWSTAFAGGTMTGIANPNNKIGATYWVLNPAGGTADEHLFGIGAATGTTVPLPAGGALPGPLVIDDNQAGEIGCFQDIGLDVITCIDFAAGGAFVCSYANVDNTGAGAFGNGIDDAVDTSVCGGATLVNASGTINEGQVTRVGQYDCNVPVPDAACANRWDVGQFSTFVNGIDEFDELNPGAGGGEERLCLVDNVTSTMLIVNQPVGITDCQDINANMDVLFVNGSQGGVTFTVDVRRSTTVSTGLQRVTGSNGKFIYHMNAGFPTQSTVGPLFDLGNECFPFIGGSPPPAVVENNVGKTNLVGSSNYFGDPISDPAKAPVFVCPTQARIDTVNFPAGSIFTVQSIHLNPAASSSKGGSLSNAIVVRFID